MINYKLPNGLLENEEVAIEQILNTLYEQYGYDFRNYSKAHVKRRILNRIDKLGIHSLKEFHELISTEKGIASQMIIDLSITVTEMFRDANFYRALRSEVIPLLRTWSYLKVWNAGCSTGEEVYSLAILLKEEGLLHQTQIYATDFNQEALKKARDGIYSLKSLQKYATNYLKAGGTDEFSKYYRTEYECGVMDKSLKDHIVWADHNLVTDSDFAEVHLLFCRNVMIYFNRHLQNHVHSLLYDSLIRGGVLCLGNKESIRFSNCENYYVPINKQQRIYKKRYV